MISYFTENTFLHFSELRAFCECIPVLFFFFKYAYYKLYAKFYVISISYKSLVSFMLKKKKEKGRKPDCSQDRNRPNFLVITMMCNSFMDSTGNMLTLHTMTTTKCLLNIYYAPCPFLSSLTCNLLNHNNPVSLVLFLLFNNNDNEA